MFKYHQGKIKKEIMNITNYYKTHTNVHLNIHPIEKKKGDRFLVYTYQINAKVAATIH